jgi:hypothetical protein
MNEKTRATRQDIVIDLVAAALCALVAIQRPMEMSDWLGILFGFFALVMVLSAVIRYRMYKEQKSGADE